MKEQNVPTKGTGKDGQAHVTSFGKNRTTCGLCNASQIQRGAVKTENKVLSAPGDYQCRKTHLPVFLDSCPQTSSCYVFSETSKMPGNVMQIQCIVFLLLSNARQSGYLLL